MKALLTPSTHKHFAALSGILLFINACTLTPQADTASPQVYKLATAYDYQLLNNAYQPVSLTQLATDVKDTDVVFIGEYHRNQASHLLQMQLFAMLHQLNQKSDRSLLLTMEMFERDQQSIVNDYLSSRVGERYLIEKAPAWINYQSSYRPLVEYAKQNSILVIAANAPGNIIRCIGRKGSDYITKLTPQERGMIATQPFAEVPHYADKFFGLMGQSKHSSGKRIKQSYLAQLTRDNTMAESIAKALKNSPDAQAIHLNGSFHSAGHLGAAGALKRINPALRIAVITPIHYDELTKFKQENKHGNYKACLE